MLYVALAVAALALLIALVALARASTAAKQIDSVRDDVRRRVEGATTDAEARDALTRRFLARLASGSTLDPEQVIEGRLWRDANAREAQRLIDDGAVRVLDVRTPQETAAGIIPGARLIPVDQLETRWRELPKEGKPWLVYCAAGARSAAACEFLASQGYDELLNLEGGLPSYVGPRAKP